MKFTYGKQTIHIYNDSKKVFMDGDIFPMENIIILTDNTSRFRFDKYSVKINNKRLSLYSIDNNEMLNTFIKEEEIIKNISECGKFIIEKDRYLYIDYDKKIIKVDDLKYNITSVENIGLKTCKYFTDDGILLISKNVNKQSTWKNISIMKIN
jgi:hypothetical protein